MKTKLTKTVQSRTENLLTVREFVSEAARQFGFSDEEISKIALAVDEACTNIIRHAYQNKPDKDIHITIQLEDGAFTVRIQDEGKQFSPATIEKPQLRSQLGKYRRGGLGVYLMKSLMDEVEYNFAPGKQNEVRLIKYLPHRRSVSRG